MISRLNTSWLLFAAVGCVLFYEPGCVRLSAEDAATEKPVISEIRPSSGPAGVAYPIRVTLGGRGFMRTGNIVTFGPVQVRELSSSDNRHLDFFVPKEIPSSGEVPPMVLPPGEYSVTVTTPAGTSEPIVFTLTRGGS